MPEPGKKIKSRTGKFLWLNKQLLYDYFKKRYNLDRVVVDKEIDDVMTSFKPRKGRAIMTQELWQKVGFNLTERYGDLSDLPSEEDVEEIAEVLIQDDEEDEAPTSMPEDEQKASNSPGEDTGEAVFEISESPERAAEHGDNSDNDDVFVLGESILNDESAEDDDQEAVFEIEIPATEEENSGSENREPAGSSDDEAVFEVKSPD
ncbi:MAG: hypothetical protein GF350_13900 [Chitinivibrionales bacterium]|nr:hypothetical protein [Chitinivibrionales bacterium]